MEKDVIACVSQPLLHKLTDSIYVYSKSDCNMITLENPTATSKSYLQSMEEIPKSFFCSLCKTIMFYSAFQLACGHLACGSCRER